MILSYIKNNSDYKNMSYKDAQEYALQYSMDQFTFSGFKIEEYLSNPEQNKEIDIELLAKNYSKINEFLLKVKEMKDNKQEYEFYFENGIDKLIKEYEKFQDDNTLKHIYEYLNYAKKYFFYAM
ncbi:hypothetical protein [Intestinibacter bartlettii]|uniref:Uncharacterized protein n=1 Tax=Intestinibacter bartlettii TaxID=261299 RepID=A0ABS6DXE6_9FIRM|nr:hypothetical protein [Intestinibacter bartlettii]MBU5336518.1 hypothetical protein [Intestinibacter bartlettii]MDO5011197.1 hypothetical protein [Intestinibacter bartlettii]